MTRRLRTIRAQELLGRPVRTDSGRVVGRIEEIRVARRGNAYEVTDYLLGTGALFERLAVARRWLRRRPTTIVVRWDQLDVSRPDTPTLLCPPEELNHD